MTEELNTDITLNEEEVVESTETTETTETTESTEEVVTESEVEPVVVEDPTKVLIGITNEAGQKLAVSTENYVDDMGTVDGIILRNENEELDVLVSPREVDAIMGEGPDDMLETDKRRKEAIGNPSFTALAGEENTAYQLKYHEHSTDEGCAICEAIKFGYLPACAEMKWLMNNADRFNEVAKLIGADELSNNTEYWTSTQYSDDYMWNVDTTDKSYKFWRSKTTIMKVRPFASASEYAPENEESEE